MLEAAEAAGATTLVGFNYLQNPMIALAREIVRSGEIGEVIGFRGIHAEDYMTDAAKPYDWRCELGGGVLEDLGSHILSLARYLMGDISSVCGRLRTVHKWRPVGLGASELRDVTVDDQADCLLDFANGATGSFSTSWVACGRKMQLAFELAGTKGALDYTQERFNELKLYAANQPKGREGFKLITAGPDHPNYAPFCPAPGHQIGFNDLKVIEVKTLLEAVAGLGEPYADFREAWAIQRVVEAVRQSSAMGHWIRIEDV